MRTPATMRRAELIQPGAIETRSVPVPAPGPGELLVRIEAALTCGTDLKMYRRGHARLPLPAPFGHEFAGTVARTGAGVTNFREGDPIAAVPTAPCGRCALCRRGRDNLCPAAIDRIALGAFADFLLLPAHLVSTNVFHRPPGLAPAAAALLEPLACVVHGASRVRLSQARTIVLIGDGPIALLFAGLTRLLGNGQVLVAGRHENRLATAARLGARPTALTGADLAAWVRDQSNGHGADVVIECIGNPAAWEAAPALAARGGEVLLYGGCAAGTRVTFEAAPIHYDEVDLKGAFHYGVRAVREAFDLLRDGRIEAETLITHTRPLAALDEALELALTRVAVKVAVVP